MPHPRPVPIYPRRRLAEIGVAVDGESFAIVHEGERLSGISPEHLVVIAREALRALPAERQRRLIGAAPEGRRLLKAVGRVAAAARQGRQIAAAAMDELVAAWRAYPAQCALRGRKRR